MPKFVLFFIFIMPAISSIGCAKITNREIPNEMTHVYKVHVVSSGTYNPIENAEVEAFGKKVFTNSDGIVEIKVSGKPIRRGRSVFFGSLESTVENPLPGK